MKDTPKIDQIPWVWEFPARLVVIDKNGMIIEANKEATKALELADPELLLGKSVFECHPPGALEKLKQLVDSRKKNFYTYTKSGKKYLVIQGPWTIEGEYAGYFDFTVELPENMPHYDRDRQKND